MNFTKPNQKERSKRLLFFFLWSLFFDYSQAHSQIALISKKEPPLGLPTYEGRIDYAKQVLVNDTVLVKVGESLDQILRDRGAEVDDFWKHKAYQDLFKLNNPQSSLHNLKPGEKITLIYPKWTYKKELPVLAPPKPKPKKPPQPKIKQEPVLTVKEEEKAWEEASFLDLLFAENDKQETTSDASTPQTDNPEEGGDGTPFYDKLSGLSAGGYFGVRYGLSLSAPGESILSKSNVVGVLFELREGWFDGFRLYWDQMPRQTQSDGDVGEVYLEWERILAAWAFAFEAPFLFDTIHISPKIGQYSVDGRLIAGIRNKKKITKDIHIKNALGLGLEVDLELTHFLYILRGWMSRDVTAPSSSADKTSATSQRFGVDLFLKGSGFSFFDTHMSAAYLLFLVYDQVDLEQAGTKPFKLSMANPYGGLGLSISW